MKWITTRWSPVCNLHQMECDCGAAFRFRVDRWFGKCPICKATVSQKKLREGCYGNGKA